MNPIPLEIKGYPSQTTIMPVTGGVVLPKGACFQPDHLRLETENGNPHPAQFDPLATWDDGSIQWILIDTHRVGVNEHRVQLVLDKSQSAPSENDCVDLMISPTEIQVSHPRYQLTCGGSAIVHWQNVGSMDWQVSDEQGNPVQSTIASCDVLTQGPLRTTLLIRGAFSKAQEHWFQWQVQLSFYKDKSYIRVEPLVLFDAPHGVIQELTQLELQFHTPSDVKTITVDIDGGSHLLSQPGDRLFQQTDEVCVLEGSTSIRGRRSTGWLQCQLSEGVPICFALRDFWQQYPKAFTLQTQGLQIGFLPPFEPDTFASLEPWYKYQYFYEANRYRIRTGQARQWDMLWGVGTDAMALHSYFEAPLVLVQNPNSAIDTGVWGGIKPAGQPEMEEYDTWAQQLFSYYEQAIISQRDYGQMNWGDWFGERYINWGNHEYDTTNQLQLEFIRTGNPTLFYLADAAARHSSEVDTVHAVNNDLHTYFDSIFVEPAYPPRAGMVHQHTVGHVGGFYPIETVRDLLIEKQVEGEGSTNPYLCLDPYNLGHVFTQGMVRQYFLTGNRFLKYTVEQIGNNLAQLVEDGRYTFTEGTHFGRIAGWTLLALAGAFELERNERYLQAMKSIVDDVLEKQDPVCGGWVVHPMAKDHCLCKYTRHAGMAGFITAILINGISKYYQVTHDKRLPKAIEHAVTFLNNDTWREEWLDWRYTSCPATNATRRPGPVMLALVNSVLVSNNKEHKRILKQAWQEKFKTLLNDHTTSQGQGKMYSYMIYGCPDVVGILTRMQSDVD